MVMTLQDMATIRGEEFRKKVQKKQKKNSTKGRFYHSFLTLVLLSLVVQLSYSAVLNISKLFAFKTKIHKSRELKAEALKRNEKLKHELYNYNSMQKVELIARNNLKMAGEGEVLVIINEDENKPKVPQTLKEKFIASLSKVEKSN